MSVLLRFPLIPQENEYSNVRENVMRVMHLRGLCHRKELNHSPRFWAAVEKVLPRYKVQRKWLKDNGGVIIKRLP